MENELRHYIKDRIVVIKNNINSTIVENKELIDNNIDENIMFDYISLNKDIEDIENAIKNWYYDVECDNFKLEICENFNIKYIDDEYHNYLLRLNDIIKNIDINILNDKSLIFIERIINRVSVLGWLCHELYGTYNINTKNISTHLKIIKNIFNNEFSEFLGILREEDTISDAFIKFIDRKKNLVTNISRILSGIIRDFDDIMNCEDNYNSIIDDSDHSCHNIVNLDKILDQLNKYCEKIFQPEINIIGDDIPDFKLIYMIDNLTIKEIYKLYQGYIERYGSIIDLLSNKSIISQYLEDLSLDKIELLSIIIKYLLFIEMNIISIKRLFVVTDKTYIQYEYEKLITKYIDEFCDIEEDKDVISFALHVINSNKKK